MFLAIRISFGCLRHAGFDWPRPIYSVSYTQYPNEGGVVPAEFQREIVTDRSGSAQRSRMHDRGRLHVPDMTRPARTALNQDAPNR